MTEKKPQKNFFFKAKWCASCNTLLPSIPENVEIIDIDEQPELANKHSVRVVPTLIAGSRRVSGIGNDMQEMISKL